MLSRDPLFHKLLQSRSLHIIITVFINSFHWILWMVTNPVNLIHDNRYITRIGTKNSSRTILFIGFATDSKGTGLISPRGWQQLCGIHSCTGPWEWIRARACSLGQYLAVWACCYGMVVRVPAVGTKIRRVLGVEIWLKYKAADWLLKVGWSAHVITWVRLDKQEGCKTWPSHDMKHIGTNPSVANIYTTCKV